MSGVRQLAARVLRAVPPEVGDPERFRDELTAALADTGASTARRASRAPADRDSRIDMVDVRPPPVGTVLVAPRDVDDQLQAVIQEWSAREELIAAGRIARPVRTRRSRTATVLVVPAEI